MERIDEQATAIGYCHTLIFEGQRPSWDEIQAYIHGLTDHLDGLVRHDVYKNRLTFNAIAGSAKLWAGQYVPTPSRIKLGTGSPPPGSEGPSQTDSDCWEPDNTTERVCDLKTTFLTTFTEYGITYDVNELNDKTYTEALLYDANGVAWAHAIISFSKEPTQVGVIVWKVQHVAV